MKFLLDENVDRRLVPFLKQSGHDVTAIAYEYPPGLLDEQVLALAAKEKRILLTNDRSDFGELIFRHHHPHCGVILFRLKTEEANINLRKKRLKLVLEGYANQLHHFLVITPKQVRVRKEEMQKAA